MTHSNLANLDRRIATVNRSRRNVAAHDAAGTTSTGGIYVT